MTSAARTILNVCVVVCQEETQDIAASIKALARSVHGDVFELPRPRFSTQI